MQTMHDVTGGTTARNGQLHVLMVNKVLKGDVVPGFTIDLAFKDLTLAMNAAADNRVGLPMGAAAHAVFGGARATGYATKDYSALLELACERAGGCYAAAGIREDKEFSWEKSKELLRA